MTKDEKDVIKHFVEKVEIGEGMSYLCGSDRYPYAVTRKTDTKIFVREVEHGSNKEKWPEQDYDVYLDQPTSSELMLSFSKKHGWSNRGKKFAFGARYYQDPSF